MLTLTVSITGWLAGNWDLTLGTHRRIGGCDGQRFVVKRQRTALGQQYYGRCASCVYVGPVRFSPEEAERDVDLHIAHEGQGTPEEFWTWSPSVMTMVRAAVRRGDLLDLDPLSLLQGG